MRRVAVLLVLLGAFAFAQGAHAAECGLPDTRPVWVDYAEGNVTWRTEIFGKPGIVAATSGTAVPQGLRDLGALTVQWEMRLRNLVGTTTAPAHAHTIEDAAQRLFDRAVAQSGCATPWIALNEMNGASTTTPWTATNAQYRGNLRAFVRALSARGARPFLLIPTAPYTDSEEARSWWLEMSEHAILVPELYFNAPRVMRQGIILGSRQLRTSLRRGIERYTEIGIPIERLGMIIGFQSGPGAGGREGLQPSSQWFRFVKLYTLAAKQVANELRLPTVWTWGWGTFNTAGADLDKPAAACVYLWARTGDPSLCDGPARAGSGFEASLTEGQIALGATAQCTLDGKTLYRGAVDRLAATTGDRELAYTILYSRLVEGGPVALDRVLAAERTLIAGRFGGSRAAYVAALRRGRATVEIARGGISDEIRRAESERTIKVPAPTEAQILEFYRLYPEALARPLAVDPAPHWLGGRKQGFALAAAAPAALFELPSKVASTLSSGIATYEVTPLDEPLPLGAVPYKDARPAIRAALTAFARAAQYDFDLQRRQERALNRTICARDDLPTIGVATVTSLLPFLALNA